MEALRSLCYADGQSRRVERREVLHQQQLALKATQLCPGWRVVSLLLLATGQSQQKFFLCRFALHEVSQGLSAVLGPCSRKDCVMIVMMIMMIINIMMMLTMITTTKTKKTPPTTTTATNKQTNKTIMIMMPMRITTWGNL
jgi:hypothetical protein